MYLHPTINVQQVSDNITTITTIIKVIAPMTHGIFLRPKESTKNAGVGTNTFIKVIAPMAHGMFCMMNKIVADI